MGVSCHFYTIHGIKIAWDESFNEAYDEVYIDKDTPFILFDGMGGEYIIFGNIIFNSGDMRWGFEDGDSFREIDMLQIPIDEIAYKEFFKKKFPNFAHYMETPFKIMTLVHYS